MRLGEEETMRQIGLLLFASVLLVGTVAVSPPSGTTSAQDGDAGATISALQTEVAELKTQVAGSVPTATPTVAPRATVSTEPQVLAEGLELLYYYTVEDGSSITLLGEVRNTTDQRLDAPYFKITFLDQDGNIVGTTNASAALVTIGPEETLPFETSIYDLERDEWQQEEIQACDWPSEFYVNEGYGESATLRLEEVEEVEKSLDRLEIEGKVHNSGEEPVARVAVLAFVYLPDGRYAGSTRAWIDVAIPPGKTARFTLSGGSYEIPGLNLLRTDDDYTYRLWVGTEPGATVHMC